MGLPNKMYIERGVSPQFRVPKHYREKYKAVKHTNIVQRLNRKAHQTILFQAWCALAVHTSDMVQEQEVMSLESDKHAFEMNSECHEAMSRLAQMHRITLQFAKLAQIYLAVCETCSE